MKKDRIFNAKFKIGDIVRYSNLGFGASTATTNFMRICQIEDNGQTHLYYYGVQYFGGLQASYESDLSLATKDQAKKYRTDKSVGRLRDYGHKINPRKKKIENVVGSQGKVHIIRYAEKNT